MTPVIIRILLRYGSGFLAAKGLLAPEVGVELAEDPDINMLLQVLSGIVAGAAAEGFYYLARKFGWAK